MDRRVFYEGRGRLVSAVMADASQLAPYVRERELREMAFFEGGTIAERIRLSIERSEKAFAFLSKEGTALILCGVAPIERPAGVSRRLGLLAGRGGLPWALSRPEAVSLLPIGVREVKGEFEKDDIVKIIAPDGRQIGVGRIACDSNRARQAAGKKGIRPFIHYDYLYLD